MAEKMSIDKHDLTKNESGDESIGSSPDEPTASTSTPQENQQPKRKGGRKPIYATSEERKQRNRQAQAAFRERRTEYIKQLEEAIRTHEQNLANLQAAHRQAADECLMLRYKNSLLERILLEKGIDVKAELRAKTGSPSLPPTHMPHNMVPAPPIQRAILNRHNARRSNSSIAPKLEPGINVAPLPSPLHPHPSAASPTNRPTPSSHSASPTATTSFGSQHASPAASDPLTAQMRHQLGPIQGMKALPHPHMGGMSGMSQQQQMHMQGMQQSMNHGRGPGAVGPSPLYAPSAFQNHFKQLDQEYETGDIMDENVEGPDTSSGPGPYPGGPYTTESQAMALSSPTTTVPPGGQALHGQAAMDGGASPQNGGYPSMTQLLDPGFDLDPFGLSASMAFPTQFSFDTSNMR